MKFRQHFQGGMNSDSNIFGAMSDFASIPLQECMSLQQILTESTVDSTQQRIIEAQIQILTEVSLKDIWEKIKSFFRLIWEKIKKVGQWIKGLLIRNKQNKTGEKLKKVENEVKKNDIEIKVEEKKIENKSEDGDSEDNTILTVSSVEKMDASLGGDNFKKNHNKIAHCVIRPALFFEPDQVLNMNYIQQMESTIDEFKNVINKIADATSTTNADNFEDTIEGIMGNAENNLEIESYFSSNFVSELEKVAKTDIGKIFWTHYEGEAGQEKAPTGIEIRSNKNAKQFMNKACTRICVNKMRETLKGSKHLSDIVKYLLDRHKALTNNVQELDSLQKNFEKVTERFEKDMSKIANTVRSDNSQFSPVVLEIINGSMMSAASVLKFGNYLMSYLAKHVGKSVKALETSVHSLDGLTDNGFVIEPPTYDDKKNYDQDNLLDLN